MQPHSGLDIDVLAQEVFRRLSAVDEAEALNDPHGCLLRTAAEVEEESEARARRSWVNRSGDAIPAPSAPASKLIQAAVLALPQRQRELLRLHVDGLTYRQIAEQVSLPIAAVLRELVDAYCQLRWKVGDPEPQQSER
jgi:DNA-directed RNA polymerase specialized sigma24 family protein